MAILVIHSWWSPRCAITASIFVPIIDGSLPQLTFYLSQVPFLDVCNTLLHPILPLTAIDYEEFGFPVDHEEFLSIKKYSPYDNIQKDVPYPAVFVTSSFNTRYALPGYRVMPGPLGSAVYLAKLASHYSVRSSIIVRTPLLGQNLVMLCT